MPPGRTVDGPGRRLWISDEPVSEPAGLWARCHERRDATGHRPVLFSWPSSHGATCPLDEVDGIDLDAELEGAWREERADQQEPDEDGLLPPFAEWPGLAPPVPASPATPDPDRVAAAVVRRLLKRLDDCHLVLVPVERNADIPAVVGWGAETALGRLCALFRSREDRFGARVVAFQGARLWVSVARPPATAGHAAHVALEHFLTGTDTMREFTPFAEYAAGLVGGHVWEFWWD